MIALLCSLSIQEQLKLALLGILLIFERIIRGTIFFGYQLLLLIFGKNALDWLYSRASFISNSLSYELDSSLTVSSPTASQKAKCRECLFMNTFELCKEMGIECQDYYVDTLDGFTLRLHRLMGNENGPPILIQHGLLMSDEAFVFNKNCSIAKTLHDEGYDVWLGNNRGNKYSWKHEKFNRNDTEYWNFTIDEIARYDVSAMINCVIYFANFEKLTYLGFSNGCAQIFAAFQDNPDLAAKISAIIGLSPAVKIKGMYSGEQTTNGFLYPLFLSPESKLFLRFFGKRAWLPSVDRWKKILTPERFTSIIDKVLVLMFNWTMNDQKVTYDKRMSFYYHLYSTTSTQHVHHWMQLIGQQQFVGYRPSNGSFMGDVEKIDYDFKIVDGIPLYCFVGTNDNLVDVAWMRSTFKSMHLFEVPGYEHLDFLCHNGVKESVHSKVVVVLNETSWSERKFENTNQCSNTQKAPSQKVEIRYEAPNLSRN